MGVESLIRLHYEPGEIKVCLYSSINKSWIILYVVQLIEFQL